MANPNLILVTRDPSPDHGGGEFIESVHRGAIAVVEAGGRVLFEIGDVEREICPRSALKPLQALAFLESGAIDEFGLGPEEIALSTASHNGEPQHTQIVAAWLKKIDCSIEQMECGPHAPSHGPSAMDLSRSGIAPSAFHNNCSGKHAAFMSLARVMGADVAGYTRSDHPVQKRVAALISEMVGFDVSAHPVGADGCAAPNFALPLRNLAHGLARMSRTQSLTPQRASAVTTLLSSVQDNPQLIAGADRACTALIPQLKGGGLVKVGAEGVYGAILPGLELGIALKIDDGAGRAAEIAIAGVLYRLGALDQRSKEVEGLLSSPITNTRGKVVGQVRPSQNWETFGFGI
jgi:L-asparaginase II